MLRITTVLALLLLLFAFGCGGGQDSPPADEAQENATAEPEATDSAESDVSASSIEGADFGVAAPEVGQWIHYSVDAEDGTDVKISIVAEEDFQGTPCLWYQFEIDEDNVAQVLLDPVAIAGLMDAGDGYIEQFFADPAAFVEDRGLSGGSMMDDEENREKVLQFVGSIKMVKMSNQGQLMGFDMTGVEELVSQMLEENPQAFEDNIQVEGEDEAGLEEALAAIEEMNFSVEDVDVDGLSCVQYTVSHPEKGSVVAVISSELPILPVMEIDIEPFEEGEEGGRIFVDGYGFDGAENLIPEEPEQIVPIVVMLQGLMQQSQQYDGSDPLNASAPI